MSIIQVHLYDDETDVEASVSVEYSTQPAEPEVGIPVAYGEIENVSMWIPSFGSVIINLDDYYLSQVDEKVADEVFEAECNPGRD